MVKKEKAEKAPEEKKYGPVKTTEIEDTVLVEVPEEDFFCAFRLMKDDWENKEAFTCPANMKSYNKEDLRLVQVGSMPNWGEK